ncbi:MAG: ferritin-like domain-containing protein [Acidimicrobiales bacterium]
MNAVDLELDLGDLGLHEGGHLLVARGLRRAAPGQGVRVAGNSPDLAIHLPAWCRTNGHSCRVSGEGFHLRPGLADGARWKGAVPAGDDRTVVDRPLATWGLAARGALVEAGGPSFPFPLAEKGSVWTGSAAAIYRQAAAIQWDPATAVDWSVPFSLDPDVEAAVVQVMTYLVENENAALEVPARFLGQIHPHFREVVGALAVQIADEARHVEVFSRRASLRSAEPALSTVGGQASLLTLLQEPDYAVAHFLLSVLGEGTFLPLLSFIETHGPDPVTRQVTHLALADEARHVAFGIAHLEDVLAADPGLRGRLASAVRRRHDALAHTSGLNAEVFDSLVLMAAGSWEPAAIRRGYAAVQALQEEMSSGRRRRLVKLGFPPGEAADLAALHTQNFM